MRLHVSILLLSLLLLSGRNNASTELPGGDGVGEVTVVRDVEELSDIPSASASATKSSRLVDEGGGGGGPTPEDDERDEMMMSMVGEGVSGLSSSTEYAAEAVAVPEDTLRGKVPYGGGSVDIDRRKVSQNKESSNGGGGGGGAQDLSFTGILNGLLDSFINDPAPITPSQQYISTRPYHKTASTSTQRPSSSDDTSTEIIAEDDEDERVLDEEEEESLEEVKKKPKPSEEELEGLDEEDEDADLLQALSDATSTSNSTGSSSSSTKRPCEGECRNIIFGLFLCDEIDNDAVCEEPGLACCVNDLNGDKSPGDYYKPYGNSSSEESQANDPDFEGLREEDEEEEDYSSTTSSPNKYKPPQQPPSPPPQQQQRPNFPHPPPHHYFYNPHGSNYLHNPVRNPPHHQHVQMPPPPPRMPLPCPRYCVKNALESYCSDRLPAQFACGVDGFCCGHDVNVREKEEEGVGVEEEEEEEQSEQSELFRNDAVDEKKQVIGPCTEEIGSCVSRNIINIICFAHASPTDMYTCPRSSMKCCARKTALPKDSLPSTTTTAPPTKLSDNSITRNASSINYNKNQPQSILPQFAPPPHQQTHPHIHNYPNNPILPPYHAQSNNPTAPPLAETPPPPPLIHPHSQPASIPSTQFTSTNPFVSNSLASSTRVPPRQPVGQYVCGVKGAPSAAAAAAAEKRKRRRRKKRVVGGADSLPGEWCWQVALINSLNQYLCGGALIGTQWVLTAAHCVTNIVRSGDAIYVRVGDHDLTSRYGSPGAQTLRVATTYIHHNHNSQTLDNDIALLKLQGNAALKEGVCLVCLPSRNHMSEIPGKRCIVTGYGYMGESGPIPLRIREANLPIVSEDECVRKVNAVTEKVFALPMSSFCAGGELRNDACQGDGGGPLVCRADDPNSGDPGKGYYELTGLVSWGFGCGRENVPGVYVKVSSFIGWIHQIIRSN